MDELECVLTMTVNARSPRYIIELASDLRKNPTPAGRILWEELKEKKLEGFKFRNQHPVYRYLLDFYCHEKRLAIEVDGDIHKKDRIMMIFVMSF